MMRAHRVRVVKIALWAFWTGVIIGVLVVKAFGQQQYSTGDADQRQVEQAERFPRAPDRSAPPAPDAAQVRENVAATTLPVQLQQDQRSAAAGARSPA